MPESTAPTKSDTQLANAVVPDSKAAVWRIVTAALIALGYSAAQIANEFLPAFVNAAIALVPPYLAWAIPAIKIGAPAIVGWLLKTAKKKHDASVVGALNTEPPEGMGKYYGQ